MLLPISRQEFIQLCIKQTRLHFELDQPFPKSPQLFGKYLQISVVLDSNIELLLSRKEEAKRQYCTIGAGQFAMLDLRICSGSYSVIVTAIHQYRKTLPKRAISVLRVSKAVIRGEKYYYSTLGPYL